MLASNLLDSVGEGPDAVTRTEVAEMGVGPRSEAAQLAATALALSEDERRTLAVDLMDSFGGSLTPGVKAAWLAEAKRRLEAYDRGEVEAIDGEGLQRRLERGERP